MNTSTDNSSISLAVADYSDVARLGELQRFAELGRLSASLLHEISNPLTAAMLCLEQYDGQQSLFIQQAQHNISILQRYVKAARQQMRHESVVTSFSIRTELDQVGRVFIPLCRSKGVSLHIESAPNHKIVGDPVKFQQIMANLISNAIDAYRNDETTASGDKPVRVIIRRQHSWLTIQVTDRGVGITADQLAHIFEPFYTTKNQYSFGLGLGLATMKQYVEQDFCGSVSATSNCTQGTKFIVKFPLRPSRQAKL